MEMGEHFPVFFFPFTSTFPILEIVPHLYSVLIKDVSLINV